MDGTAVLRAYLDTRHDLDAEALPHRRGLGTAGDRIVVGDGHGRKTKLRRVTHKLRRSVRAVGDGGMKMKVYDPLCLRNSA